MGFLEDNEDRPKVVNSSQEQIGEDGEIFEAAKIDEKKIAKISDKAIIQGVIRMSEVLSGVTFRPYQIEAAERIVRALITDEAGVIITIEFARQSGKSTIVSGLEVGGAIMLPLLAQYIAPHVPDHNILKFKNGIWIGNYAPDYERAGIIGKKTNTFLGSTTSRLILSDPDIGMTFPEKVSKFNGRLPRNSYINIKSANKKVSIEGDTYHWVTTDETQEINDYVIKKSLAPMLASCIVGSSRIQLTDGRLVSMNELQRGKYNNVVSINSHCRREESKVETFIDSGVQETIKLTLKKSHREIEGTVDHPVLVYDRSHRKPIWKKLGNIKVGEHVCLAKELPYFGERTVGGVDEARFIGMMIGDGSYLFDGVPKYHTCDDVLFNHAVSVASKHDLMVNTYKSHATKDGRLYRESTITGVNRGHNWLIQTLDSLWIYGQRSVYKRFSKEIFELNKKELAALIGGYFDTDGCVSFSTGGRGNYIIKITSVSKNLIFDLLFALQKFGIHGAIATQAGNTKVYPNGKSYSSKMQYKLTISGKEDVTRFYNNISFKVAYKQSNLEKAISIFNNRTSKRVSEYPDLVWEGVKTIEYTGKQQVWDIVVPKNSCFIANGIVCHNTAGIRVHLGSPFPKRVYFYDAIKKNKQLDLDRPKNKRMHFEADYTVVQKYDKNYKRHIESEKLTMGAQSDEFRMSYELYWPVDKGMFVSDDLLLNRLGKSYNMTTYDKTRDHVIGIDVGKIQDPTVITVLAPDWENPILVDADSGTTRYVKPIKNWLEIADDDYDMQFHLICDFLGNYKWRTLVIDATGVGQHMYDRLKNKYSKENKQVIPFVYSRPNKSHLFTLLARELVAERVTFPNNSSAQKSRKQKKFVAQMLDMAKQIEGGYLNIVTTTDKGHDDYPNSLALAVYGVESDEIQTSVEEVVELEGIYSSNNSGKNFWH